MLYTLHVNEFVLIQFMYISIDLYCKFVLTGIELVEGFMKSCHQIASNVTVMQFSREHELYVRI